MAHTALITGATSGIGEATAYLFAEEGYDLILTGRRHEILRSLKKELEGKHGVEVLTLCFDVSDRPAVDSAIGSLHDEMREIDILVNNAGLVVGLDHFNKGDVLDWELMVNTNIKGLLYVTRKVSGIMIERGGGHIVNVGSLAGTQPFESGAVYSATKHAVHALSQGMRIDFLEHGIKVTEIRPGMVETSFRESIVRGDKKLAEEIYRGITPLSGEDIAEAILWAVSQPTHVNVDEIVITPTAQANAYYTFRQ